MSSTITTKLNKQKSIILVCGYIRQLRNNCYQNSIAVTIPDNIFKCCFLWYYDKDDTNTIKICTWNILANAYCKPEWFSRLQISLTQTFTTLGLAVERLCVLRQFKKNVFPLIIVAHFELLKTSFKHDVDDFSHTNLL